MHYLKQTLSPQKFISKIAHFCANNQVTWFKNYLIRSFLKKYIVNMQEAVIENPYSYSTYNDFFTRKLKTNARPISKNSLISPADGVIAQFGQIKNNRLIQAKNHDFLLTDLIGADQINSKSFINGKFCTIYLAPHNYHRVHMPLDGIITQMSFIPGKLFSVSTKTAEIIPNLFARNERLVVEVETKFGKIIVILVGAMIVGSIETVWRKNINYDHPNKVKNWNYEDKKITLKQGDELGLFKLGSTVIVLLPETSGFEFSNLQVGKEINFGESLAIQQDNLL